MAEGLGRSRGRSMGEEIQQLLQVLVTGLAGIGLGGYGVHRKLKADRNSDTLDSKASAMIERLEEQLDSERKHNAHLAEAIDRVARERNDAVQQVGRLEGTVHALQSEVERMSTEVIKLEKKNKTLSEEITNLSGTVRNLSDQIHVLLARLQPGPVTT